MKKTWTNEDKSRFFQISSEKTIPVPKNWDQSNLHLHTENSVIYLKDIGHVKDLIAFLQEFIKEYKPLKGGDE